MASIFCVFEIHNHTDIQTNTLWKHSPRSTLEYKYIKSETIEHEQREAIAKEGKLSTVICVAVLTAREVGQQTIERN